MGQSLKTTFIIAKKVQKSSGLRNYFVQSLFAGRHVVGFKSCFAYRVTSGDSGFALDGVDMDSESAFEQQLVQSGKSPKGGGKKLLLNPTPQNLTQ